MSMSRRNLLMFGSAALCVLLVTPFAGAQDKSKKSYAFKGKVDKVDAAAKKLTVTNEDIPGWMMGMSMAYGVDKESVLQQVKAGDRITATVYDGDFKTLYDVKVVPPEKKQ